MKLYSVKGCARPINKSIRMRCRCICNCLLNLYHFGCFAHAAVSNGRPIKCSLITHLRPSLNLPICPLILSLVMAYPESSILKSERRWMTAVIKPRLGGKKEERKGKSGDTADQFWQTDTYWSSGLSVQWCCRVSSQPDVVVSRCTQVCYAYSEFSQTSSCSRIPVRCAAPSQPEDWLLKSCALSRVNPTPTIIRAQCHMKVCTKLNGY